MWEYNLTPLQAKLLDKQVIDLSGEIDLDMASYVKIAILHLISAGAPDIKVNITSNGGDIMCGFNIYDEIRLYPGHVTGLVSVTADSMAAVILQACDIRQCMEHSTVTIHDVTVKIKLSNHQTGSEFKEGVMKREEWQGRVNTIYAKRASRTISRINKQSKKDRSMTAQEALAFRLIDEIV